MKKNEKELARRKEFYGKKFSNIESIIKRNPYLWPIERYDEWLTQLVKYKIDRPEEFIRTNASLLAYPTSILPKRNADLEKIGFPNALAIINAESCFLLYPLKTIENWIQDVTKLLLKYAIQSITEKSVYDWFTERYNDLQKTDLVAFEKSVPEEMQEKVAKVIKDTREIVLFLLTKNPSLITYSVLDNIKPSIENLELQGFVKCMLKVLKNAPSVIGNHPETTNGKINCYKKLVADGLSCDRKTVTDDEVVKITVKMMSNYAALFTYSLEDKVYPRIADLESFSFKNPQKMIWSAPNIIGIGTKNLQWKVTYAQRASGSKEKGVELVEYMPRHIACDRKRVSLVARLIRCKNKGKFNNSMVSNYLVNPKKFITSDDLARHPKLLKAYVSYDLYGKKLTEEDQKALNSALHKIDGNYDWEPYVKCSLGFSPKNQTVMKAALERIGQF